MDSNKIISRFVDFLFSKDNRKWILLLVIIGFILRTLLANHLDFAADEMLHGPHSIGFIESGKLQIMDQDAIWFFLTDLSTKIFGVSPIGIRFLQIFFDTLSIILVYLIGKELFNEKTALIASIIYTFSPFQLLQMRALMDLSMSFFVLFSLYFLILFIKENKKSSFLLCWLSLGIAIMIKQIALWFIPAFIIFLLYYNKKTFNTFKLKQIIYAAVIIFIIVSPVLTFNYLLYKDKKLVDLQFARFTKVAFDKYKEIAHTIQPFSLNFLLFPSGSQEPGIMQAFRKYRFENTIVVLLAVIGLFFIFNDKNKFLLLILLSFFMPFIFLAGTSTLINHFVYTIPYISLLAGLSVTKISQFFKQEKTSKVFIYSILILILVFSLMKVYKEAPGFFGKNELGKLIDSKNKNIEKDSLVIVDSRIYRGRIVFMFWDKHYLETNYFSLLIQNLDNLPGEKTPMETYFIEAVTDDSGWGTVKSQPEFNQSTENIVEYFKNNSGLLDVIYGVKNEEHFKVYKTNLLLKQSALQFADSTHDWFYYPVAYKPKGSSFDDYTTYNAFDSLLDKLAHLILYAEMLITILLTMHLLYLLYKTS